MKLIEPLELIKPLTFDEEAFNTTFGAIFCNTGCAVGKKDDSQG